jgi:hypothetical protein
MALTFFIATPSVQFSVLGDGSSTSITVDLTKPPLGIDLSGNTPVSIDTFGATSYTATLVGNHKVEIAPTTLLTAGQQLGVNIALVFNGD